MERILKAAPVLSNQAFNSLANFLITVALLRVIGVSAFGNYSVYYLIALNYVAISTALICSPMVSIAPTVEPSIRRRLIVTSAVMIGVVALLFIILCALTLIIVRIFSLAPPVNMILLGGFSITLLLSEAARRFLFFLGRPFATWLFDGLRISIFAVSFLWLHAHHEQLTVESILIAQSTSNAIGLLGLALVVPWQQFYPLQFRGLKEDTRRLLKAGSWLSLSNIVHLANDSAILLAASALLGEFALGILRSCQTIIGLINPFMMALEHIIPKGLGLMISQKGETKAWSLYWKGASVLLLAFGCLLGGIGLFAKSILAYVIGADVAAYSWVLIAYCFSYFLVIAVALINFAYRAREQTLPIFLAPCIAAGFSLAACIPLMKQFGLEGAVICLVGAQSIIFAIQAYLAWRDFGKSRASRML